MERCVTGTGCTLKGLYKFLSFFNETNADDINLVVLQQHLEIKSIQRSSTALLKTFLMYLVIELVYSTSRRFQFIIGNI